MALAATTLHEPELLLLDEPTAGVDPQARRQFWDEIHALSSAGLTVLVSTHYMDEAERCHDIAYIAYGQLMARGTAGEILDKVGLVTWQGEGPGVDRLSPEIAKLHGVEAAAPFGITLHVSGTDAAALDAALADVFRVGFQCLPGLRPGGRDLLVVAGGLVAREMAVERERGGEAEAGR